MWRKADTEPHIVGGSLGACALICRAPPPRLARLGHVRGRAMPKEQDLNSFPGMTKWFSPRLLVWAAYRDAAARIFGEYADRRTTQHLADPIPSDEPLRKGFAFRYDYATGAADGAFWVDFVADIGDGFDPTYAIAYLVA